MAFAATRQLLVLFVTFCAIGRVWTAERSAAQTQGGRAKAADRSAQRQSWEPPVQLDGSPVDRYSISATKPIRAQHRLAKAGRDKDASVPLLEDVDPEWANLDGFAVVGGSVNVSSAAGQRPRPPPHAAPARVELEVEVASPVARVHRRPPQSSSGPRQPYSRALVRLPLVERRRQHSTKPQSDQRNRNSHKLASESVHVVSLQAQRTQTHRSAPVNRAVVTKAIVPEPEEEAKDITVRVMSPQSVLISWVDPVAELGKVAANQLRYYMVKYREKGESARWEYKESTQRRLMIDNLSADGMYEFSVRITQGENHGKWSVSVFQRTPESAPSGPPENFEVKPLRGKGTAVTATWDPPEEPNGRIREYILSYAPATKPFGMKSVTYRSSTTSATIDGLTPGDRYIFKIKATNRRGQGPLSKAFSVAMPGTLSSSKSQDSHRASHTSSTKDRGRDESDLQSAEVTEAPQTTQAPSTNRRVRPLSQSRSYHSIFSAVRGSVRNGASSLGKKKKEKTSPTTPPPEEEPVTVEAVEEKEPDNDVVYPEPEVISSSTLVVTPTPQTTTLKPVTLAPTTAATSRPRPPPRRPIKIRVHQKPGSKASSSSSSSSISSSSSSSSTSSSLPIPSHSQETSIIKKDSYIDSLKPESKVTYAQPSLTQSKPSMPVPTRTTAQPKTVAPPLGKDPAVAGRTSGSLPNSRYGFGQRNSGILLRGNFTRNPNGYKYRPASTANAQSNLPGRTQNQASSNTDISKSQSTLPTGSQNRGTSGTSNSAMSRSNSRTGSQSESTSNTDGSVASRSRSHSPSTSSAHNPMFPFLSRSGSRTPATSETHDSGGARSTSHRMSNNPATSHNTHNSRTPEKQDTTYGEESDDTDHKNTGSKMRQAEEQTSSVQFTTLNTNVQTPEDDRKETEEREDKQEEKTVLSPARVQPSHAERLPSLASRNQGRFGAGTRGLSNRQEGRAPWGRTSSSLGEGRPILQGSARRVSGASGAAGVSKIQETSEIVETASARNPLKNGVRESLLKPSLTVRKNDFSESRQPSTSSTAPSSSNSDSHHSSSGHRASSEPINGGASNNNNNDNDHDEEYLYEGSKETVDRNEKVLDPTVAPKTTTSPPVNHHKTSVNRGSGDKREPSSGSRTSTSYQRRPSMPANGRVRSPVLANRQSGGYRLPFRVQPAQNTRASLSNTESSSSESTSSSSSSNMPKPVLTSDRGEGRGSSITRTGGLSGGNSPSTSSAAASYTPSSSSSSASSRDNLRTRTRYPNFRGKAANGGGLKPSYGNDKNGRPNLTTSQDKESSTSELANKARHRLITGPDGKKWVVDLDQGLLMNEEGQALQDSQGRPRRVVLGEDGQTIFDLDGSPLVNHEGLALFGHGRDGRPVVNPKDKVLTLGGKLVLGLDRPHHRTTTTRAPTTTTTRAPTTTTTKVPTTTEWFMEESTTLPPYPTCPPGTFSKTDEYGYPLLDPEGILDCYPEEESSGMESDYKLTDALALEQDNDVMLRAPPAEDFLVPTTLLPPPTTTTTSTTTTTTTTTQEPPIQPGLVNKGPSSALDLAGKKRFTAPYMNYIKKDVGAPCSLTEALEYLQVDILEELMDKDTANQNSPPKNKPHNITVVAMEGCHSFVILDWARPLKDDMVSGYMVHSASYDDILNNRWSSLDSGGTHLAVENLKPNSRYYFKVQAKNVFGLGPVSETLTYVTESDDPLLIERPPGGEPIWIPFSFKYNHAHSGCRGSQFVKRTWYRKFVGVVLCNSLRYKIFMGEGLREPFYSIADTFGQGEDHCQFVDSYLEGRTGPVYLSNGLPTAQGFYRSYRQEPVTFGTIGRRTAHPFVGWYECGVPIPGKW